MNDAGSSPTRAATTKARTGMRATVSTAVATAALVAATVLSGPAATAATPTVSDRIAGVQEEMALAVALQQMTAEQAAFLERQLVQHIRAGI